MHKPRKLSASLREYKRPSVLASTFMVLEVLVEVLIPLFMANIIDNGIMQNDMEVILKEGAMLIFMALLAMTFGILAGRFAAVAAAGYAKNLRGDVFRKIQAFSFYNIDRFSTSSLVTRMTTDLTNVQMAYMMSIRLLARTPVMMVLALVMTTTINPRIAMVFLVALPILAVALGLIVKVAHPYFVKVFAEYDHLNATVQENVTAARVVKAYVREPYENEKFRSRSNLLYRLFSKAEKTVALNSPTMQFSMYVVVIGILLIGGHDIVEGRMLPGQLTSVMVYAIQILISLMVVTFVFVMNIISQASRERIREVLNEIPEMQDKPDAVQTVADGSIVFDHVHFSYAGQDGPPVLKDINLRIPSGTTVGILGGTGSAKSTLVQMIPRLYDVTEGSVQVGGVDVRDYSLKTLRDEVSMVLQKNTLFTGTIADNIRWGDLNASDEEVERVCRLAQADEFIQRFPEGYDTYIVQGGNNVSGGQKQRLCIARALLKKPKILILDDSTSAVDTKTDQSIRRAFREEIPNTTKIIIAQRIASIEDADMIIVLEDGRIDGIGTSEELLRTNAIYRDIYESQNGKEEKDGKDA